MDDLGVIFAGGGTGGHLYPALAILQSLEQQLATTPEHLFICSNRPLDSEILTREGVEHLAVPAAAFSIRPRGLLRLMRSWAPSVRAGRGVIRHLRAADKRICVVAMGGFVAPPIVQGARAERVPRLLINLDAVPGKANRWIAKRATRVLSVQGAGGHEPIPPIVRTQAIWTGSKQEARTALGLDPETPTLLITGGSQGAGSIDRLMLAIPQAEWLKASLDGWQVLHQARSESIEALRAVYESSGTPALVVPFLEDIGSAWGAADLALARSGAGAVAEVWANRVPTIFMPYPGHSDDHQRLNALPLEEAGGALIVADEEGPMGSTSSADNDLASLLQNASARTQMQAALASLGPADGADHAARAIIDLAC